MKIKRSYGTGSVFQPKGTSIWYLKYHRDGQPIVESTREITGRRDVSRKEAEEILRDRLHGADRGEVSALALRDTRYGTLRNGLLQYYREQNLKSLIVLANGEETVNGLGRLDEFFGYDPSDPNSGWPLARITSTATDEFKKQRLAEFEAEREADPDARRGNAVINRSLAALRNMLNRFAKKTPGFVPPSIELLPEPPARRGFIERDKFLLLLSELPERLRPLITYLYWTGCRIGETSQITWQQVDLEKATVQLLPEQTKNGKPREIPLANEVLEALRKLEPLGRDDLVFDTMGLRNAWNKACVAAGLGTLTDVPGKSYKLYDGLIIHDLRRTAVRNLRKAGISESVVMGISGHTDRNVFERYNVVDNKDTRAAMQQLDAKVNGHKPSEVEQLKAQVAALQAQLAEATRPALPAKPSAPKKLAK